MSCVGEFGIVGIASQEIVINQQLHAFICPSELDSYFLATVLQAQKPYMEGIATKTTISYMNKDACESVPIPLPPLPEQQAIAAILSTWDEAIALTEALIEALQQRKQALMQLLLTGEVRFEEFEASEWNEAQIQDIAQVNKYALSERTDPEKEFYYIDLSSVNQGYVDMPDEKITFQDAPSRARRVLSFGDVIMATVRPNLQGFALCDFDATDVICSTGFALISPNDLCDSRYIYQNLFSHSVLDQIQNLVTGSNYPAINANEVKKLVLPLPEDIQEREKIGEVLSTCDSEVAMFKKLKATLTMQKQALMQQLLTGAIRVQGVE
jgi:type I restriction enzyme, S subunit